MASSIPSLFGERLAHAVRRLPAVDLARLRHERPGRDVAALGWMDDAKLDGLRRFFATLRQRDPKGRYKWRQPQEQALAKVVDSADPRHSFVVAAVIDDVYDEFAQDADRLPQGMLASVAPRCASFFADIDNAPPAIGQMTSLAVVRDWMLRFWWTGSMASVRVYGEPPSLRRVVSPPRVTAVLRRACEQGEVRVALVGGPAFAEPAIRHTAPGLFVVERSWPERSAADLARWHAKIATTKAHFCVFPEGSFSEQELATWRQVSASSGSGFPVLSVLGLVHRASEDRYTNDAVVLDHAGRDVMWHEKLEPFSIKDPTAGERMEHIIPRTSDVYCYLDTPAGRVVVNICRDVRSDLPMLLNRVLSADWLLVPAYSKRLDFAMEEGRVLGARQRTFSAAVNPWTPGVEAPRANAPVSGTDPSSQQPRSAFVGAWPTQTGDAVVFPLRLRVKGGQLRMDASPPILV